MYNIVYVKLGFFISLHQNYYYTQLTFARK